MHPARKAAFAKMSPFDKLCLAAQLNHDARILKAAGLRRQHPEWSEERIQAEVRRVFLYATT